MSRVEVIGNATLYLGDAREIVPTLQRPDAIISDPPYGMDWDPNSSRFSGGNAGSKARRGAGRHNSARIVGDDKPFDPAWLIDAADKVTLWGFNHFAARLPVGTTLVWIKRMEAAYGSFLSDAELAWEKGNHGVYCRRDTSMYAVAADRVHPAQKPLGIMAWCIERASLPVGGLVCDPYMGSASTGVAALRLGHRFIGVEIDPEHFAVACERIEAAQGATASHERPTDAPSLFGAAA